MSKRALRGIAAAAVGASVMLTALVGVEIGAMASTNPPKSKTCVEAIAAFEQAQGKQSDAKKERDSAKSKADAADAELARAKDPANELPKKYKTREDWITAAKADAAEAHKAYQRAQKDYDESKGHTANRKAAADQACQGEQGTPGTPGTPGPAGPAGPAGQPGQVVVKEVPGQQAPAVIQAPAPQTVESDLKVAH